MDQNTKEIVSILKNRGQNLFDKPKEEIKYTKVVKADKILNDIERYPHIFVLGCVMDRQIKAERAWLIPYKVSQEIGGLDFNTFLSVSKEEYLELFNKFKYHRFNEQMAKFFFFTVERINQEYQKDASLIWAGNPSSASIVRRFLEFKGIAIKIASMAVNILARDYKIPMKDYINIDISPDRHVNKVFRRTNLVSRDADSLEVLYRARELNPEYPGIFDLSCFEIGRTYCHSRKLPECKSCYLENYCPRNFKVR